MWLPNDEWKINKSSFIQNKRSLSRKKKYKPGSQHVDSNFRENLDFYSLKAKKKKQNNHALNVDKPILYVIESVVSPNLTFYLSSLPSHSSNIASMGCIFFFLSSLNEFQTCMDIKSILPPFRGLMGWGWGWVHGLVFFSPS